MRTEIPYIFLLVMKVVGLEIGKDSQGESLYFVRINDTKGTKKSSTPIINEIAVEDPFFNDMGCCRRNVGSQRQKS